MRERFIARDGITNVPMPKTTTDGISWTLRAEAHLARTSENVDSAVTTDISTASPTEIYSHLTWHTPMADLSIYVEQEGKATSLKALSSPAGLVQYGIAEHGDTPIPVEITSETSDSAEILASNVDFGQFFHDMKYVEEKDIWIAGGDNGKAYTSTDLLFWKEHLVHNSWQNIGFLGYFPSANKYYAQSNVSLFTSTDFITWTTVLSDSVNFISDVVYGNGKYVTSRGYGDVYQSTDLVTWTSSVSGASYLRALTFAPNNTFIASQQYACYRSTDATTWVSSPNVFDDPYNIIFADGDTYAASLYGRVWRSTDYGVTWSIINNTNLFQSYVMDNAFTYWGGKFWMGSAHYWGGYGVNEFYLQVSTDCVTWVMAKHPLCELSDNLSIGAGRIARVNKPDTLAFSIDIGNSDNSSAFAYRVGAFSRYVSVKATVTDAATNPTTVITGATNVRRDRK